MSKVEIASRKKEEAIDEMSRRVVNDLKELRESKNITTSRLSEMTGILQGNITRMETGKVKPNLKTVATIAYVLGAEIKVVSDQDAINERLEEE